MKALNSVSQMMTSVGVLMFGTLAAQVISFGSTPILSRLFGPEAFGQYGLFMAMMTLLASTSGGRLELAVSLPRQERTSQHIAAAARFLALAVTLAAMLLVTAALGVAGALLDASGQPLWLLAIPPVALLIAWNGTYAQQNLRALEFAIQARLRFLQSALYLGIAVLLGWAGFVSSGLIVATFATQALIFLFHHRRNRQAISGLRRASAVVRRYRDFPTKQVPATLIETGTAYLPVLFIAPQFGSTVAGYFFFAQTVLRQPVAFLSNSIGEIYRQWLSRQVAHGLPAHQGTIKAVLLLTALSVAIFVPIIALAHWLVPLAFGVKWSGAAAYFQVFALISAFQFVASPISSAFFILSRQHWDVILQMVTAATLLATLSLAILFNLSAIASILAFASIYMGRYTLQLILSVRLIMGGACN